MYSNVNWLSMFFFNSPVWNQVIVFLLIRINNRLNEIVQDISTNICFFYTLFSNSDLLEILFILCRSPRTAFRLYHLRTANGRSLGIVYSVIDVSMKPFLIIISAFQNLIGYMSMVNIWIYICLRVVHSRCAYYKHHQQKVCKVLGVNGLTISNSIFTRNLLERTTEIGPPIGHPSTFPINPPYIKKLQASHNLLKLFFKK